MKIGIMTWWRNANYGGFLQGLALQTFLQKNGFDVELINYDFPPTRFSVGSLIFPRHVTWLRYLLLVLANILRVFLINGGFLARIRRLRKTCKLFCRYLKISPRHYAALSELNQEKRYGAILIGSDQVWSPYSQDDEFSYLLRGVDDSVRKMSYAASVAALSVHPHEKVYAEALMRFDAISVREKTNVAELEKLSGKKVEWVVDPTLLLSADDWRELLKLKMISDEPHITFYCLSPFESRVSELVKLAKDKKTIVHIFTDVQAFHVGFNPWSWIRHIVVRIRIACSPWLKLCLDADAREWLQDLSTAEYVLSDSFHALMFATIFARKITTEIPASRVSMSTRIKDFKSRIGELGQWQEQSKAWLLKSLHFD